MTKATQLQVMRWIWSQIDDDVIDDATKRAATLLEHLQGAASFAEVTLTLAMLLAAIAARAPDPATLVNIIAKIAHENQDKAKPH